MTNKNVKSTDLKLGGYDPSHKNYKHVRWSALHDGWVVKAKFGTDEEVIEGLTVTAVSEIVGFEYPMIKYSVKLSVGSLETTIDYQMGYGNFEVPSVINLLWCLFLDANSGEMTFDDFCADFGYNNDSISDKKLHEACQENGRKLRYLFGTKYFAVKDYIDALEL